FVYRPSPSSALFPYTTLFRSPSVSLFVAMAEEVLVIDLAGSRLLSSGVVTDLEVGYFVPAPVDIGDEVSFVPLHVIDIVQDFARRAVDGFAQQIRLVGSTHEQIRVVAEGFKYHDQVMRFENLGSTSEGFDDIGSLDSQRKVAFVVSRHHRHPGRVDAPGRIDAFLAGSNEVVDEFFLAGRE